MRDDSAGGATCTWETTSSSGPITMLKSLNIVGHSRRSIGRLVISRGVDRYVTELFGSV